MEVARRRRARFVETYPTAFHIGALAPMPVFMTQRHQKFDPEFVVSCFNTNTTLRKAWHFAQEEILTRMKSENSVEKKETQENLTKYGPNSTIAVMAYTLDEPQMFQDFNKQTRDLSNITSPSDGDILENLNYYPLYKYLADMELKVTRLDADIVLYRGCACVFQAKIGQTVSLCNFTSTSVKRKEAEEFEGDEKSTILIFVGMISGINTHGMTYYRGEAEMLLFPFQTFIVEKIETTGHGKCTQITLRSRTADALALFQQVEQYFPMQEQFKINGLYYLTTGIDEASVQAFLLRNVDLHRFGYVSAPSDVLISGLPNYHILQRRICFDTIADQSMLTRVETIVPNIHALSESIAKNQTVFQKSLAMTINPDDQFAQELEVINPLSSEELLSLYQECLEHELHDENQVQYASFVFTDEKRLETEQAVKELFPAKLHNNVRVCQIEDKNRRKKLCLMEFEGRKYLIEEKHMRRISFMKKAFLVGDILVAMSSTAWVIEMFLTEHESILDWLGNLSFGILFAAAYDFLSAMKVKIMRNDIQNSNPHCPGTYCSQCGWFHPKSKKCSK